MIPVLPPHCLPSPPSPHFVFQAVSSWGRTPLSLCCQPHACCSCRQWFRPAVHSSWSSSTPPTVWVSAPTPTLRAAMTCRGPLTPTPWWVRMTRPVHLYTSTDCRATVKKKKKKNCFGKYTSRNDDVDSGRPQVMLRFKQLIKSNKWGSFISPFHNYPSLPPYSFPWSDFSHFSAIQLFLVTNWFLIHNAPHTIIATMAVFSTGLLWWLWNSSSIDLIILFLFLFSPVLTCLFPTLPPSMILSLTLFLSFFLSL